jgi:putative transposase
MHQRGIQHVIASNKPPREFNFASPDMAWLTDITDIRTHEGWLYLAVVVDFLLKKVIGWSTQSLMTK